MLKALVPSLVLVSAIASVQAEDIAPAVPTAPAAPQVENPAPVAPVRAPFLGCEFGVSYHLFNDNRYSGASSNFAVVLLIDTKMKAALYHESGRYYGTDSIAGATFRNNLGSDITEIRFRVTVVDGGEQDVQLMLGMGYASYNSDVAGTNASAPVIDSGIHLTALKKTSGPVQMEIGINALYRYSRFSDLNMLTAACPPVYDLGGFVFGLNAGLFF
jgi:hypothetical protein